MTEEQFEVEVENKDGWYRQQEGDVFDDEDMVIKRYKINNHYIKAWDGYNRIEQEEENKHVPLDDRWTEPRSYNKLTDYLIGEFGCGQPRNVCSLSAGLAKLNGIKMSELFLKYEGV